MKKRAARVRRELALAFPKPAIPLLHRDAFTFLVAVILSSQCTDKRVNASTPALFRAAPTPRKMAALSPQKLEKLIRSCGLYTTKAKNLIALSRVLLERHNGHVPSSRVELEALPGVGRKTASVILSQCFGVAAFPVDAHIFRLARRWGLSRGRNVRAVESDLCELFREREWNALHLRFIYYGRAFCSARGCCGPFGEPRTKGQTRCKMCEKLRRDAQGA